MSSQHILYSSMSMSQATAHSKLSPGVAAPAIQHTSMCFSSQMTACNLQSTDFAASGWCPYQANQFYSINTSAQTQLHHMHSPLPQLRFMLSSLQHMMHCLTRHVPVLDPDTKFYLLVLLCIAAANSVFTFVRAFSFAYGGLAAATKIHEQLLAAIAHAPAAFFHTTPAGMPFATCLAISVC